VYHPLIPWIGTGLLIAEGDKWFRNRKLLTSAFHYEVLKSYVQVYNECTQTLIVSVCVCVAIHTYLRLCATALVCVRACSIVQLCVYYCIFRINGWMKFHIMIQLKFVNQSNLPHWTLFYSVPSVIRTTVKTVGMLLIAVLLNVLLLNIVVKIHHMSMQFFHFHT